VTAKTGRPRRKTPAAKSTAKRPVTPAQPAAAPVRVSRARHEAALFGRVLQIIDVARGQGARAVNTAMVHAYWMIGREILEVEQAGVQRAGYGDEVIDRLAERLGARLGKGFGVRTLWRMRQFYQTYPSGSALPPEAGGARILSAPLTELHPRKPRSVAPSRSASAAATRFPSNLGWSHYLVLLGVANPTARAFYEIEATHESWSSRELERQVASLLFERLARSRNKKKVLALARRGHQIEGPADVIKEPFVLEFLGLDERAEWRERELEQAIIERLEKFLLELGKGFCFVARQKRLTLDGDHFFVDLVLYNRLLRCFVLVDLKLGKLTHQDLGQMQMYVNFFDRFQRADHEAKTIGIVLCSEKNDAMAKITLPEDNRADPGRALPAVPAQRRPSCGPSWPASAKAAERALRAITEPTSPRPRGRARKTP
jgi:predicted nuclease of restriction endonuclease-like (RecB) superfamily